MKQTCTHIALCIALACMFTGCLEIETTTKVHSDGRLTRTVVFSGDSSDFTKIGLRIFGLDSGWTVVSDSSARKGERKLTLQREFDDAESASRALAAIPLEREGITLRLEKRFRWFTSVYRYEESWQKGYVFDRIPLSSYLSPEEIEMFHTGELKGPDSLLTEGQKRHRADLEKRGEEWFDRNSFEEIFAAFLEGVRSVQDPRLTPESVLAAKESLFTAMGGSWGSGPTPSGTIIGKFAGVLKDPAVPRAWEAAKPQLEKYDRAVDFMQRLQAPGYSVGVIMPGIITNTNGSALEGTTVRWKDIKDNVFFEGYTMWVESRVINWWAIIVSAVVLIAIGGMLVVGLVRKR
jgi:hypothetical protein